MPELPEVECTRRSVEPFLVGRVVTQARAHRRDVVALPGDPVGGFGRAARGVTVPKRGSSVSPSDLLEGCRVSSVVRTGKQIAIVGDGGGGNDRANVVQLGMTGRLVVTPAGADHAERAPHTHVEWTLDDGHVIGFVDARRFGLVSVCRDRSALDGRWAELGPDALAVTDGELADALAGRRTAVKAALLDQGAVAGVGNIYADESLHAAGIHPRAEAGAIGRRRVGRLAGEIRRILAEAIRAGGSTLRDFTDAGGAAGSYQRGHAVYGRGGEPCRRCGGRLATGLVAQRTTVWCPRCQRGA